MGKKYQMLCHYPNPLPRGREGSLTANNPSLSATNVIRLNRTHLFLNLQQNFSFPLLELWLIASKLSKICSNSPKYSANYAKFAPIINPFILHYVSGTCPGREPSEIPANYANSTQFAHIVRESREIHTIC